jgi:cell division protein FtsB
LYNVLSNDWLIDQSAQVLYNLPNMSEQRTGSPISLPQLLSAATLAFAVFIFVVLAQRLTTSAVLWKQTHQLQAEIDAGRAETQRLEERKRFVQTDEYVESVARNDMKMGKAGEVSALPVPMATGFAATPNAPPGGR